MWHVAGQKGNTNGLSVLVFIFKKGKKNNVRTAEWRLCLRYRPYSLVPAVFYVNNNYEKIPYSILLKPERNINPFSTEKPL